MVARARKFKRSLRSNDLKKKLAPKTKRNQQQPVFSISLIRKGSIKKLEYLWKHLVSKIKSFKIQPLIKKHV